METVPTRIRRPHSGPILCSVVSRCERAAATGGKDTTVRIYEIAPFPEPKLEAEEDHDKTAPEVDRSGCQEKQDETAKDDNALNSSLITDKVNHALPERCSFVLLFCASSDRDRDSSGMLGIPH